MTLGYSKEQQTQYHAKDFSKYNKRSTTSLKAKAIKVFHKWVKERDKEGDHYRCISCGQYKRAKGKAYQAGHYYPAGEYESLRFDPINVNGECLKCNYYSGDHLIGYKENLIKKVGIRAVEQLKIRALASKRRTKKRDRFEYIEIIEKYK